MKIFLTIALFAAFSLVVSAQTSVKWRAGIEAQKVFIENKSQFDGKNNKSSSRVLYATDEGPATIYFTADGVSYRLEKRLPIIEKDHSDKRGKERYFERGEEDHEGTSQVDIVHLTWQNANPGAHVEASEPVSFHYSYTMDERHVANARAFKKLTYKNLYPNIDVVYEFHPTDGIKYSLILYPGADITRVKMKYSGLSDITKGDNGDILLPTRFGYITDQAPLTFYSDNMSEVIPSTFVRHGKTVSFSLGQYDRSRTVIIDPWTTTPSMPNVNSVFYIKSDSSGNAYIYGGDTPFRLQKYDTAGNLLWTYSTAWSTNGNWFGALGVDRAGNSYITNGDGASLTKITSAGTFGWSQSSASAPALAIEFWTVDFNCDESELFVGGTRTIPFAFDFNGAIFKMNKNNGSIISYVEVVNPVFGFGSIGFNEVRSTCSAPDGNIYFLTLDTVGSITSGLNINYRIPSTYSFPYYLPYSNTGGGQGQNNMRATGLYLYTTNGQTLHKRDINNGAILATVSIPAGSVNTNSGVAIDSCGNVFVGAQNAVLKYDADLNFISSTATPQAVYDISIGSNGDVLVCGHSFAVALDMDACVPQRFGCYSTMAVSAEHTDAFCNLCNGTATANALSGTSPYTYQWSNSGSTQTITGLCAGIYNVTITDASGTTAESSVTVAQIGGAGSITASADQTIICSGDTVLICATPGHDAYLWNTGETTQCIATTLAGNYYVTVTDGGTCTATSNVVAVSVYPLPSVSISVNGDTMTVYNASNVQWYLNDVAIPNATSNVYIAQQTGNYTVEVTDSNGCKAMSTKISVLTGIADLIDKDAVWVYPNPLKEGNWQVQVGNDLLNSSLGIYDNNGRLVYEQLITDLISQVKVDVAAGVYFMRIHSGNRQTSVRLVKL